MTPEELETQIVQVVNGQHPEQLRYHHGDTRWDVDPEVAHLVADALLVAALRELGYAAAMDIYEDQCRWYG